MCVRAALIMFCNLHELMNSLPCFLHCTLLFKGSDLAGIAGLGFTTAGLAIPPPPPPPRSVCALPTFTQLSQERGLRESSARVKNAVLCASSARIAFHLDCCCSVVHKSWVRAGMGKWCPEARCRCAQQPVWKNNTSGFSSDYNQLVMAIV